MKYIGIDPGPHTGTVIWNGRTFVFETLDYTEAKEAHSDLWMWLVHHVEKGDTIICERFEYQPDKENRGGRNYDAAEYVGVVKLFGQRCKSICDLVTQSPSYAVGKECFWTDDKLRKLGLWRSVKHERDALRHLLQYVTFKVGDKRFLHELR